MSRESWSIEDLRSGKWSGKTLAKVKADAADWSGAKLRQSVLAKARLRKADLSGADLSGADLSRADLRQARLVDADLSGANLEKAELDGADFTGANLSGAVFTSAKARETVFDRANGAGSNWSSALLSKARGAGTVWTEADFSTADLVEVHFSDADFRSTKLDQSVWINAELQNARFDGASAAQADFFLVQASDCRFDKATLPQSNFSSGRLTRVAFDGADLSEAQLTGGRHEGVTFDEAILTRSGFKAVKGYDEAAIARFGERGAKTSNLLWLRFLRLLKTNHWAQLATVLVVVAMGLFAWRWYANPKNWSYSRLEKAASQASGQGRNEAAVRYYRLMIDKFGEDPLRSMNAKSQLAQILKGQGEYDAASALFAEVLKDTEDRPELKAMRFSAEIGTAEVLVDQRRYDEAVESLSRIARQWAAYPESARALDALGTVELQRGRVDEARKAYEAIITGEQYSIEQVFSAQLSLARLYRDTGRTEQAVGLLRTAWNDQIDVPARGMSAGMLMIEVLLTSNNIDAANKILDELRDKYPDEKQELMNAEGTIALAEQRLGDDSAAIDRFRRLLATAEQPDQVANLVSAIASGLQRQGRAEEALAELDRGIQQLPRKSADADRLRFDRVTVLQNLGKDDEAARALETLADTAQETDQRESASLSLINLHRSRRNLDKAETLALALLERTADRPRARSSVLQALGDIAADRQDADKALSWWAKMRDEAPDPDAAFQADMSALNFLRNRNDPQELRTLLDAMIKRYRDNPLMAARTLYEDADWRLQNADRVEAEKTLLALTDHADTGVATSAFGRLQYYYGNNSRLDDLAALNRRFEERFPNRRDEIWRGKLAEVDALMESERYADAERVIEEILKGADPRTGWEAWMRLVDLRFRSGDPKGALSLCEDIPSSPTAEGLGNLMSLAASRLSDAGMFEDAITLVRKSMDAETRPAVHAGLAITLSQLLVRSGQDDEARQLLEGVLSKEQSQLTAADRFQIRLTIGQLLVEHGDADGARHHFEAAVAEAVDENLLRQANAALIRIHVKAGRTDEARAIAQAYATRHPDDPSGVQTLWANMAEELHTNGKSDEALAVVTSILPQVRTAEIRRSLLWTNFRVLSERGRREEAIEALDSLVSNDSGDRSTVENARLQKAYTLAAIDRLEDASKEFEWVLDNTRDEQTSLNALSGLTGTRGRLLKSGEFESFIVDLEEKYKDRPVFLAAVAEYAVQVYRSKNMPDAVVAWYEKRLKATTKPAADAQVYDQYARFLAETKRHEAARELIGRAEKAFKDHPAELPLIRMTSAELAVSEGRLNDAIEVLQKVAKNASDPRTSSDALVRIAQLQRDSGKYEESLSTYRQLEKAGRTDVELANTILQGEADTLRKSGRFDEAVDRYRQLAGRLKDPNGQAWVLGSIIQAYREAGRYPEAVAAAQDLLQRMGDRREVAANTWSNLVDLYRDMGKPEEARAAMSKVAEFTDQSENRLRTLLESARFDVQNGKVEAGLSTIDGILKDPALPQPLRVDALVEKARCLTAAGRAGETSALWTQAIDAAVDPGQFFSVVDEYAGVLSSGGRSAEAIKVLEGTVDKAGSGENQARLLMRLADMRQQSQNYDDAERDLTRAVSAAKGTETELFAKLSMAQLDANRDRLDAAKKGYATMAASTHPPNVRANAYQGLASIARRQNNSAEETAALKNALEASADRGTKIMLTNSLAMALADAGRLGEADTVLEKALEKDWPAGDRASLMTGWAQIKAKAGKPDEARKILDQVIREFGAAPGGKDAYRIAVDIELARDNEGDARKLIQEYAAVSPATDNTLISMRQMLVNSLSSRQKWDAALKEINAFLKDAGPDAKRWGAMEKVRILNELKKPSESEAFLRSLIADQTLPAELRIDCRVELMNVLRLAGRTDEAIKTGWAVAEEFPDNRRTLSALFQVAQLENEKGGEGAIRAYEKILGSPVAGEQDSVQARMGLAAAYEHQEKPTAAIAEYEKVFKTYPKRIDAGWAMLGAARLYKNHGEQTKAVELYERIVKEFASDQELSNNAKEMLKGIYKR